MAVGGEDSSRADDAFLLEVAQRAQEWGASRFRFCDTVGILDPFTTYEKVRQLVQALKQGVTLGKEEVDSQLDGIRELSLKLKRELSEEELLGWVIDA